MNTTKVCMVVLAGVLGMPCLAAADARAADLKSCLDEFAGIEWKLPYRPPVNIYRCTSAKESATGHPTLELIGELTLGADSTLSSDENTAAVQTAVFVHFDTLFQRQGFRLIETGQGDARTKHYPNTLRMLHRLPPLPEEEAKVPDLPPIPYVNLARYVRQVSGQAVTLTYKTDLGNTWLITLEPGQAAAATRKDATR